MIKIITMLAALGAHDVPRKDINCLATVIYHEARGEPLIGQMAVAHVVMNRVRSDKYPDNICDVVYQPYQFSYIDKAIPDWNSKAWDAAVREAVYTYFGLTDDVSIGATHYYAHNKVNPDWASYKPTKIVLGGHTFK